MTEAEMRRALELISQAQSLHRQLTEFVLLKRDQHTKGETIQVGDPVKFRTGEWHRVEVQIPDDARRYVFQRWRREIAHQYNRRVRELSQLGASHPFTLVQFSPATGDPL